MLLILILKAQFSEPWNSAQMLRLIYQRNTCVASQLHFSILTGSTQRALLYMCAVRGYKGLGNCFLRSEQLREGTFLLGEATPLVSFPKAKRRVAKDFCK
jgi:hypothetical protein